MAINGISINRIGFKVSIAVSGDVLVINKLKKIISTMENPMPLWNEIGRALVEINKKRMDSGRGPDGRFWKKSLRAKLGKGKTLINSGKLQNSLQFVASKYGITLGSNLVYSAIHQLGGTIGSVSAKERARVKALRKRGRPKTVVKRYLKFPLANGKWVSVESVVIPARPFLGVSRTDEQTVLKVVEQFLGKQRRGR